MNNIEIRLEIIKALIPTCSKNDIIKSDILPIAEKFYEFIMKAPVGSPMSTTPLSESTGKKPANLR